MQPAAKENRDILVSSDDGRTLKRAAIALARSQDPGDHQVLSTQLGASDLCARLDPPEEVSGSYQHLRLARVMRVLMENRTDSASRAILSLTGSPPFQDHYLRIQVLIRALAAVRPSPPPALQYWQKYSQPGSPVTYDVIEAVCRNQSPRALELLEAKWSQPAFTLDEKRVWARESILVRRYDRPLLESCERVLHGAADEPAKISLVDVLYDYRPDEWFIECSPPTPPPLAAAGGPTREILQRLAEHALEKLGLPARLEGQVRATLGVLRHSG